MINQYIKSLIEDNKRIIIPDFGGFVVKRSANGDVISFNSFLNFNDDLLVNTIVENENIEKEEALKQIKEWVNKVNNSLDEEGKFDIKEVGFLIKDKKQNIRFVDEIIDEPIPETPTKKTEKKQEVPAQDTKEQAHKIESPNNTQDIMKEEKPIQTEKKEITETEKKEITETEKKKKGGLLWLIILIVILVMIALLIFFTIKHKQNKPEPEKVAQTETVTKAPETTIVKPVMSPCTTDTINGILVVADKNISPKGKERYNVILGSFEKKKNAEKFNKKLTNDGNPSQIFDRYNGFTAVSLGGYPSLDIALKVCGEALPQHPDIWILVK